MFYEAFMLPARICILLCIAAVSYVYAEKHPRAGFLIYKGAWFDVEYPRDFTVKPSIASSTPGKFDSAFFESPDKDVRFYVFSPQWSGEALDIAMNPVSEVEKDVKKESKDGTTRRWFTYAARNGSRARSFLEITTAETKLVFGFEYADQASYKKYLDSYLHFKKSIAQYAD